MTFPLEFDYTALSTFARCHKRYWWRMIRNLVPNKAPTPLEYGKCMHKALDVWFETGDVGKAHEMFRSMYVGDPEDDKRTAVVAEKSLKLYAEKYAVEPFKVISTEKSFTVPLSGTPYNIIGRIDKIIDWDGVVMVMDHKVTSRLGAEYFNKIKPNMQFDMYIMAARALGFNGCCGILLDAILVAKGLLVPAQLAKLTPVARDESTRTDEELELTRRDVLAIIADIKRCYEEDVWYRNTDACTDFVSCPYRKLCCEVPSVQERLVKMDYREEKWDPRVIDDV